MIAKLLLAFSFMSVCVIVHASGITWALRQRRRAVPRGQDFWGLTRMGILLAGWMIVLHLIEIVAWGFLYWWNAAMPDAQTAFYFSAVTYTTTGYGDLVLPPEWRIVGGIEALTGILMCGWSTAFFFAVLSGMFRLEPDA
jgi:hypothetical protein